MECRGAILYAHALLCAPTVLLNTTFITVKAAAIDAIVQATKWDSLKIFNDPTTSAEYKTGIEPVEMIL